MLSLVHAVQLGEPQTPGCTVKLCDSLNNSVMYVSSTMTHQLRVRDPVSNVMDDVIELQILLVTS